MASSRSVYFTIFFLILTTMTITNCLGDSNCNLTNIIPQQEFNISTYLGDWYLMKTSQSGNITSKQTFTQGTHNVHLRQKSGIQKSDFCDNSDLKLHLVDPATRMSDLTSGGHFIARDDRLSLDIAIIATDYETYSLTFECFDRTNEIWCTKFDVELWQRSAERLSGEQRTLVNSKIDTLCLTVTDMHDSITNVNGNFTVDCPANTGNIGMPVGYFTLISLIFVYLLS